MRPKRTTRITEPLAHMRRSVQDFRDLVSEFTLDTLQQASEMVDAGWDAADALYEVVQQAQDHSAAQTVADAEAPAIQ